MQKYLPKHHRYRQNFGCYQEESAKRHTFTLTIKEIQAGSEIYTDFWPKINYPVKEVLYAK